MEKLNPWDNPAGANGEAAAFADLLLKHLASLPTPRSYWSHRHPRLEDASITATDDDRLNLQNSWLAIVMGLSARGYLDDPAGNDCPEHGGQFPGTRTSVDC